MTAAIPFGSFRVGGDRKPSLCGISLEVKLKVSNLSSTVRFCYSAFTSHVHIFIMIDEDWDNMTMDEIGEYFKDKNFYEDTSCNCPKWNRMLRRIGDTYGDVRPDPQTGFGIHPDHYSKKK